MKQNVEMEMLLDNNSTSRLHKLQWSQDRSVYCIQHTEEREGKMRHIDRHEAPCILRSRLLMEYSFYRLLCRDFAKCFSDSWDK